MEPSERKKSEKSTNFQLSDLFAEFSKKMQIDFEGLTKQFKASTSKGNAREEIIKSFLGNNLYGFLGLSAGEIVSVDGNCSNQQDVIIYDKFKCPIFYRAGDTAIYPCEGVYAVIEVKSKLDKAELEDAVSKIRSVKKLKKEAFKTDPFEIRNISIHEQGESKNFPNTLGIIFAYDSTDLWQLGGHLTKLNNESKIPIKERVDLVCVLNKGLLFNLDPENKTMFGLAEKNSQVVVNQDQPDKALIFLYYFLMERLNAVYLPPISVQKYAQFWLNYIGTEIHLKEPNTPYQAPRGQI
jgi:hypothetical protein